MSLTKYTASTAIIASLADLPNATDGLTAAQLKAKFDENPTAFKTFVNALIDELESTTDGSSGADQIGATSITGLTGSTVQALIESLKTYADNLSMGAVADGAVTNAKLATDVKVGSLAVLDTTTKTSVVAAINEHLANTTPHATVQGVDKLGFTSPTTLTIASGAITVTNSFHLVDTESSASADDLNIISGGAEGDILYLRQVADSRDITIKSGIGNILTFDGSDITFNSASSVLALIRTSANWRVIGIQGVKRSGDTMTGNLTIKSTNGGFVLQDSSGTDKGTLRGSTAGSTVISSTSGTTIIRPNGDGSTVGEFNFIGLAGAASIKIILGTGSPEGTYTANVSSLYLRSDGSTTTTLYIKTSGTGNTGWTAK